MARDKIIPRRDYDFHIKQAIIADAINANADAWQLDKQWITNIFNTARNKWETAWENHQDKAQRSMLITFEKNNARTAYEPLLRSIVNLLKTNTFISIEERAEIDIFPRKRKSHIKEPTTCPDIAIIIKNIGMITISYYDRYSLSHAKPYGVHCIELKWEILENPPHNPDELTHSEFATSSPFTIQFPGKDRGKTVWMCARWQNTKGKHGAWSYFHNAIIP
jgi:hypothetical protein